jgi:hypothetical protein
MTHWRANPKEPSRHGLTEPERLAIAETEINFIKEAVSEMASDVRDIKKALTTAAGVKLALMTIGAAIAFVLAQLWHYLDFRGLK